VCLGQGAYVTDCFLPGRNMRDRTKEVEKLKKQLQQLQEIVGGDPSHTSSPEQELVSGGRSPASSEGTPAPRNSEPASVPATTAATDAPRHMMNEYMQAWPHSHGAEQLSGLGLMSDGDTPMAFNASNTFFPQMSNSNDVVPELAASSALGRRARAVTTGGAPGSIQHHPPPRSHSMSATFSSNCPSPIHWGVSSAEGRETLPLSSG
jgi:hypothetical protein